MKKMKKEQKKKILISLIVIFGTILILTVGYLIFQKVMSFSNQKRNEETQTTYAPSLVPGTSAPPGMTYPPQTELPPADSDSTDPTAPKAEPVDNLVNIRDMQQQNPEVYSWIYIPDTMISLPVLQSTVDDNFYLHHDWLKNDVFAGAIYSQSKNKKDYSDRVTVLYGHNMADGSMFANLHYFSNEDFFDNHKYFYIYTEDRRRTYEVVSATNYDDKHILNSYDFSDDAVFSQWLEEAKNPRSPYSLSRSDVELDLNSKMLVLSTCTDGGRFIVQGVLVRDEQTK